jgi:SPP1 family predicted phage head-tail adaptor
MKCIDFIGKAKDRVTIDQKVLVADDYGSSTNTWTEIASLWAWVRPVSTFERSKSEQIRGITTHKIVVRYQDAINDVKDVSAMRLTLDTRIHSIRGIKLFDQQLKNYGSTFIEILTDENAEVLA